MSIYYYGGTIKILENLPFTSEVMNRIIVDGLELHEHFTYSGVTVFFCSNNSYYYYGYCSVGSLGVTGKFKDSSGAWEVGWRNILGVL